ncbi:MAG: AzlC family ABC transporter permease [Phormidesmis sp.]
MTKPLSQPPSPPPPSQKRLPRSEFLAGARDIFPLIVGAIPFGIIFGTLATNSGLSPLGTMVMSAVVFAGASQFIATGMIAAGSGWLLIVLTAFVVNLRHLLYAVSLVPYVKTLPQTWKIPLAFWLTDEAYAVVIRRYETPDNAPFKHWYYLGAALTMYANWQLFTLLGITVGQLIPNAAEWGLDFAMSVTFIGMVIPYIKNKPMAAAVVVSAGMAIAVYSLPHKLGLMVAAVCGISTGVVVERVIETSR